MAVTPAETVTTTSPAGAAEQMMPLTITHLVLIVLAMAATIVMIWWGSRLFRARKDAEDAMEDRGEIERVGDSPVDPVAAAETPEITQAVPAEVLPFLAPQPIAAPAPAAPMASDLTLLKGLGPKVAAKFETLGVTTIAELAALTPERAEALDTQLGNFRGRMARDRWIEQARLLDRGDRAGYEATFGKLDR